MKKVVCVEMYKASINVVLSDVGYTNLYLGCFEHKKDAVVICKLVTKILEKEKLRLGTRWIEDSQIVQEYFPETQLSQLAYYGDLTSATKKDWFVDFYRKHNGKEATTNLIIETLAEVNEQRFKCFSNSQQVTK